MGCGEENTRSWILFCGSQTNKDLRNKHKVSLNKRVMDIVYESQEITSYFSIMKLFDQRK